MNLRALFLALFLVAPAFAAKTEPVPSVKADVVGFAEQREAVEAEMVAGGRFAEITPDARTQVAEAFDRMQAVLDGKASMDALRQRRPRRADQRPGAHQRLVDPGQDR